MKREQMTNEQRLCVDARNSSIVVSAAAGSGKTAVLVERVISLLCDAKNPVPADSIVVVTFTEAAAKEMRQRIKDAMTEKLKENPEDVYLQEQSFLLSSAQITTMHSFCMNLLKTEFHRFGLKAGFVIANEAGNDDVMKADAINEVLEKYYGEYPEKIEKLISFFSDKDEKGLIETVLNLNKFLSNLPFPEKWIQEQVDVYSKSDEEFADLQIKRLCKNKYLILLDYLQKIEFDLNAFERLIENEEDNLRNECEENIENLHNALNIRKEFLYGDYDVFSNDFTDDYKFSFAKKKYVNGQEESTIKNRITKNLGNFDALVQSLKDGILVASEDREKVLDIITDLFDFYKDFEEKYRSIRREENVITFNDLIRFTFELICDENGNKTEFAKRLSERYSYIILDEFQDTDDMQDLIFSLLSKDESNLFIVGDSKQSIYRFRNANPEILINKKDIAEPYSENDDKWKKIFLNKNFRSRKGILDFSNFIFSKIMKKEIGGIEYDKDEELYFGAEYYPEVNEPEVEVCLLDDTAIKENNPEMSANAEAVFTAQRIRSLVDKGFKVTGKNGEMRPCNYNDILVLVRQKGKVNHYIDAFNQLGIPCVFEESEGYYIKTEIIAIMNILKIIDNPLREIETVATMMSPMFLFTAEEIAKIRAEDRYAEFYSLLLSNDDEKVKNFVEIIKEFREYKSGNSIEALVKKIYADTSLVSIVKVLGDGEQRVANLTTFLNQVKTYETKYAGGLGEFIRYIERIKENGGDNAVLYSSTGDNAVKIMTMHKSKGLESPICIVTDLSHRFKSLTDQYILSTDTGISIKIRDKENLYFYNTLPFDIAYENNKLLDLGDTIRILYVALTRAKEKLILTIPTTKSKLNKYNGRVGLSDIASISSIGDLIQMSILAHNEFGKLIKQYCDGELVSINETADYMKLRMITHVGEYAYEPDVEFKYTVEGNNDIAVKIVSDVNSEYKNAPLSTLPSKVSVTELVHGKNAGMMIFKEPAFMSDGNLTGAQIGTAHHKFMQYADFEVDVEDEIKRLENEGKFSKDEAKCLKLDKLKKVMQTDVIARINSSQKVLREYAFMSEITAKEYNPTVRAEFEDTKISVQGVADCVFEEPDGLVIVDYKTDRVDSVTELANKYKKQLELYAKPIEKALGKRVKEKIILSISLGEEIKV